MSEEPAFLCGAPRSGTTLLSNLLDWNEKYLVLPEETHLLHLFNSLSPAAQSAYFLRDYLGHHDLRFFIDPDYRAAMNQDLIDEYGAHGALANPELDCPAFIDAYLRAMTPAASNGHALPLSAVYRATAEALRQGYPSVKARYPGPFSFIEKRPLENEMSAAVLKRAFPKAKFVHIVRDPRTRYLSAKARRIGRFGFCGRLFGYDFPTAHALIAATSFACAKLNAAAYKDDYLVIKYEDLVADRPAVMRRVAAHLGIPYADILEKQTRFGQAVESSSSFKEKIPAGSADVLARRREKFEQATSPLERYILSYYCADAARDFGYDLPAVSRLTPAQRWRALAPVKNEAPWHYPGNRRRYLLDFREQPRLRAAARVDEVLRAWHRGELLGD